MTSPILRPCRFAGGSVCPELVSGKNSLCPEHQKETGVNLYRERGTTKERGYGADWERVRLRVLERDKYVCCECLRRDPDLVTIAVLVDHITPLNRANPLADPNRLRMSNLESLCRSCHEVKTASEKHRTNGKVLLADEIFDPYNPFQRRKLENQ